MAGNVYTVVCLWNARNNTWELQSPERESQCCGLMIIHDSAESQDQEPRRGQVEQMSSRAHSITLTATVYNTGGVAAVCSERSSRRQFI